MKTKVVPLLVFVYLALMSSANAQLAVAIAVDPTWPLQAARWASQIAEAAAAVEQARALVGQGQTLLKYAGNPREAIANLADVSSIVNSVGRMTNKSKTADQIAKSIDAGAALAKSANSFRKSIESMSIYGSEVARDPSLYKATLALEGVVGSTRKMVEKNRRVHDDLAKKLATAFTKLHAAATQTDVMTVQAEIQRITAMMQAAEEATRNFVEDAKLKKEEREIALEVQTVANIEEAKTKSVLESNEQEAQRTQFQQSVGKALADGEPAPVDSGTMFQRSIFPSLP
jgi:signal transduction histidine kinase